MNKFSRILALMMLFLSFSSYGLVPLESLVLGDFSAAQDVESLDPLNYIFLKRPDSISKYHDDLAIYRGFIAEGENLTNKCENVTAINYPTYWFEQQARRSYLANLQYVGLDITIRALSQYAKEFEFTKGEYKNFVDGIVGNSCSTNISVISIRQLKKNMMALYDSAGKTFDLPSIEGNPLFPQDLRHINKIDKSREQEFAQTVKLFESFCSWGGDTDNLRLLVPLVKSPIVMSFIAREISGKKLKWQTIDNSIYKVDNSETVQVICENLICRKKDRNYFNFKFPRSMGFKSYLDDLERGYCSFFQNATYTKNKQVPQIKKIIDKRTDQSDILLVGQFIALLTGVPDFMVRMDSWKDGTELVRASVDRVWKEWATDRNEHYGSDLFFEEALTIERVDRKLFYNAYTPKFRVDFDVNLGEYDRVNQLVGKVTAGFKIKLTKSYLAYMRNEWINLAFKDHEKRERLLKNFHLQITNEVQSIKSKFPVGLWKGNLERLIIKEVLDQISEHRGSYFKYSSNEVVSIPVNFNFAPFALKYLNYKYTILDATRKAQKKLAK